MRKSIFMVFLGLIFAVPAFAINKAPLKELIVASDGEYTSISAALASLPNPNPGTNPVVIKVMPGTYVENIVMKDNVGLQGAGKEVTIINGGINIVSVQNVSVSGFNINFANYQPPFVAAITVSASSPAIKDNLITISCACYAVDIKNSSSPIIEGNTFKDNPNKVIVIDGSSSAMVKNNIISNSGDCAIANAGTVTIIGNLIDGAGDGIDLYGPAATVINNVMRNGWKGIRISGLNTILKDNIITGSYGESDIIIAGATPNISFNIYDTFTGTGAVGMYNVKSDGTPAPLQ